MIYTILVFLVPLGIVLLPLLLGLISPEQYTATVTGVIDATPEGVFRRIEDVEDHLVRYYGSYANRARREYRAAEEELDGGGPGGRSSMRMPTRNRSLPASAAGAGLACCAGSSKSTRCCVRSARWR